MSQLVGYSVVLITVFFFVYFLRKKSQQLRTKQGIPIGYCLLTQLSKKEEPDGVTYVGVFQQGEKEWQLLLFFQQFTQMRTPQRGYLIIKENSVQSFTESEEQA